MNNPLMSILIACWTLGKIPPPPLKPCILPKSICFNFLPIKIACPLCGWRNEKTLESTQCAGLSDKGELAGLPEKSNGGIWSANPIFAFL
ncbi:hypothetical protein CDAR_482951 [Caerostris darwini]|uniref:Uncharacterized protein n=1 Tax=Caerostris darwini TaxID=1538125 RepID=A0AAV4MR56_9ARAC|nr:hypothetical protein CDAR_482951 [Caerostris darwini]